jgi:hypothetical protein
VYSPHVLSRAACTGLRIVSPLLLPHLDEISPTRATGGGSDDVPVLILVGDANYVARPAQAQILSHQVAAHGRLVLFQGAGHHRLPGSARDLFNRTILAFCQGISTFAWISSSTHVPTWSK